MYLKRYKYDIEVQNDDAIKRNRIFFDFMQKTFNSLYGLYLHVKYLLIDMVIKYQSRKHSTVEIEEPNREKRPETKERKLHLRLIKKGCFANTTT